MQKIRVTFDGFWASFNPHDNFIVKSLSKYFCVEVVPLGIYDIDAIFYCMYATEYLKYDCVRIYYTGENAVPDFNLCDYAIGFEPLVLGDRFFRYPVSHADFHDDCILMESKNEHIPQNPFGRKFCAMVVSNSLYADTVRENFFYELSNYKRVDSGGRYLNNIGMPSGVPNKIEFLKNYKFSFAFENVSHIGYCTEKLPQSFAAGTIPIYWGAPNVAEYFNPKSFINLHDYASFDDAIADIKRIDNDETLYMTMLSEPATVKAEYLCTNLDHEFEDWLAHIFLQRKETRLRANRNGYAKIYADRQQRLLQLFKEEQSRTEEASRISQKNFTMLKGRLKYVFTHSPKDVILKIKNKLKNME